MQTSYKICPELHALYIQSHDVKRVYVLARLTLDKRDLECLETCSASLGRTIKYTTRSLIFQR